MKKKLSIILTIVMVLTVLSVVPASAGKDKPISGRIDLDLELSLCLPVENAPNPLYPFVTWVGTVVIDGTTYGWADFPTADFVEKGNLVYFAEYWTIFTLAEGENPTVDLACNGDLVVLAGTNTGSGTPGGTYKADGEVTDIAPGGPFADVAYGSRMMWRGKVTNFKQAGGDEFKATFHIFPPK